MTNIRKERTVAGIKQFQKRKKDWMEVLAYRSGIGTKAILKMLEGDWDTLEPDWWEAVSAVVCTDQVEGAYETNDCKTILKVCSYAQENAMMIGITGDTGMGKTHVLKAVAEKKNVYYVQLNVVTTPKTFIDGLLLDLNKPCGGSKYEKLKEVAMVLNSRDHPLLIIDEASKMNDAVMQTIHALRDKTMGQCGIVLAGMPQFKNKLINGMNAYKNGYSEFFRRVNMWQELRGLTKEEMNAVLKDNGITSEELAREFRNRANSDRFGDLLNSIFNWKLINEMP